MGKNPVDEMKFGENKEPFFVLWKLILLKSYLFMIGMYMSMFFALFFSIVRDSFGKIQRKMCYW